MSRPTKSDGSPIALSPRVANYIDGLEKEIASLIAERDKMFSGKSDVVIDDYDGTTHTEKGVPSNVVAFWLSRERDAKVEVKLVTEDEYTGPHLQIRSVNQMLNVLPSSGNTIYITEERRYAPPKANR